MLDSLTTFLMELGTGIAAGLIIGRFVWGNS